MMTRFRFRSVRSAAPRILFTALVLAVLAGMCGCRTPPTFGNAQEFTQPQGAVPLRPGLVISMSVLVAGKKEIDEPAKRVSESGTLTLPLLGEMAVSEMSLEDFQAKLVKEYKAYFVQPQVILDFVRDGTTERISPWGYITVLGQVKMPGRIAVPATQDMTLSEAIQRAGGFAPSAKDNAIIVTRTLPGGKPVTRTINLRSVGAAGRVEQDILLQPNDVVFVPESLF